MGLKTYWDRQIIRSRFIICAEKLKMFLFKIYYLKMKANKKSGMYILPVMFGFFIMGFIGIIGIAINYVKNDMSRINDDSELKLNEAFYTVLSCLRRKFLLI